LVECNISRKKHITQDVRSSNCCAIAYVVLSQNILERPGLYELDRQSQTRRRGCHCWELQDESFAFCERIGTACVDLLNRVFSTHLIGFVLRSTKQERKSKRKRWRYYVSLRRPWQCILQVSGNALQQVETFKYVGVVFTSDGSRNREIDARIGKPNAVLR